jgi:hypothetical protein
VSHGFSVDFLRRAGAGGGDALIITRFSWPRKGDLMAEAHPLSWPPGWARTTYRRSSDFKSRSIGEARDELLAELRRLGARNIVISSNAALSSSGLPTGGSRGKISDPGVAVYFQLKGKPKVIPCDRWDCISDNLYAIALWIESERGQERWVNAQMVDQVFVGLAALPPPPPTEAPEDPWWKVLGCTPDADLAQAEALYKIKAKHAHPDAGGSHEEFTRLSRAIEQARAATSRPRSGWENNHNF